MAIQFATPEDQRLALRFAAKHLPRLIDYAERTVSELGLSIQKRLAVLDGGGIPAPVLVLKSESLTLQLSLRRAVMEFLFIDPDADRMRVDRDLANRIKAQVKLWRVVRARTDIIMALMQSNDPDEFVRTVAEQADGSSWIKIIVAECP